jgi:LysR family transcriptional regulator, glycine cleavage system transcriptional activator
MAERLPPLIAVRYFEVAARQLSFTKAAQELHVTHSAISHQIKALEEWLGVPLFRRLNRSIVLTEAGQAYVRPVREALEKLGDASRALKSREQAGTLTVSVMPSFAAKFVVPRLGSFRRAHPDIDVRISASERLVDFAREDVDAAVRYGRGNWAGLRIDRLVRENLFPVCSPKLRRGPIPLKTPADLLNHNLLHDSDWPESMWTRWLAAAGVKADQLKPALSFNYSSLMIQAAIDGLGVALAQEALVRDDLATGRLVRPFDIDMPSDYAYYVVSPEATAERPKVAAFRNWLLTEACTEAADAAEPRSPALVDGAAGSVGQAAKR